MTEPTSIFYIRLRGSQILLGYPKCNRSVVGRKSDISGGISTLWAWKKKGGRATKGRRVIRQGGERGTARRPVGRDGEKLISRRPRSCARRRIKSPTGFRARPNTSQQNLFGDSFRTAPVSSVQVIYILSYSSHPYELRSRESTIAYRAPPGAIANARNAFMWKITWQSLRRHSTQLRIRISRNFYTTISWCSMLELARKEAKSEFPILWKK